MHYLIEDYDGELTRIEGRESAWTFYMVSTLAVRLWGYCQGGKKVLLGGLAEV